MRIHSNRSRGFELISVGLWLSVIMSVLIVALQFNFESSRSLKQQTSRRGLRQLQQELQKLHESSFQGRRSWEINVYHPRSRKPICHGFEVEFGGNLEEFSHFKVRPLCPRPPQNAFEGPEEKFN